MNSIRLALMLVLLVEGVVYSAEAQWIWSNKDARTKAAPGTVYFRKTFPLGKPQAGHLEITCDNQYLLYFNGRRLGTGGNWAERHHYDVTKLLQDGSNVIAVAARNEGASPAGLVVRVHVKSEKEGEAWHSTDASWKFSREAPESDWRSAEFDDTSWAKALALGVFGETGPWGAAVAKTAAISKPVRVPGPRRRGDGRPFAFEDGDRVVLVGSTYVERMQAHGYLETLLTVAHPNKNLTFRNLGWSGDDVTGIARAVFGKQADGFRRLEKDLLDAEPTVILVCYGGNEAHAGEPGLSQFEEELGVLLELLEGTGARIAFLSPMAYESLGSPLPNPAEYNEKLKDYCRVLESVARGFGHHYVDLYSRLESVKATDVSRSPAIRNRLTDNGVHLNEYGYWRTARRVARGLGATEVPWKIDLDVEDHSYDVTGTQISDLKAKATDVSFTAKDLQLTYSPPPATTPRGGKLSAPHALLRVRGLQPGNYGLRIDDQPTVSADAKQWSAGVRIHLAAYLSQVEELRQVIAEKNELYFHRYRPQNETYLFLFRKHEQGNNAVEIPQFDPLVADKEKQIAALRLPQPHSFRLVRLKKEPSTDE